MTYLMRESLRDLYRTKRTDSHAGLLIQRGLIKWEKDNSDKEKTEKKTLISDISAINPSKLYQLALKRWIHKTYPSVLTPNFTALAAKIDGRLMTGLPLGGALETGVTTHHSYGMPLLSGSSIKGAVRNYAEHLYCEKDEQGQPVFENNKIKIPSKYQQTLVALFGTDEEAENQDAGYLIWHDAWWLPTIQKNDFSTRSDHAPFVEDIITVHHQLYYQGSTNEATGMESPIPNLQLAVQGQFYFVIEGAPQWLNYAQKLLEQTIKFNGLGSKTSSDYGYFVLDDKLTDDLKSLVETLDFEASLNTASSDDPYIEVQREIRRLSEKELVDAFSKKINSFFENLNFDRNNDEDAKAFVKIAMELHKDTILSWENSSSKNQERAYKFIQNHL